MEELRSKAGLPVSRELDGKPKMAMSSKGMIPKKPKQGESKSLLSDTECPTRKLYQLCAKYSPSIKNAHNTSQCYKWKSSLLKFTALKDQTVSSSFSKPTAAAAVAPTFQE